MRGPKALNRLDSIADDDDGGGRLVVRPESVEDVEEVVSVSRTTGFRLRTRGSGSMFAAEAPTPSIEMRTTSLEGIVDYQPDDLTVVVRAGTTLETLGEILGARHQDAVLIEDAPGRTIGGVVSEGTSGFRRLRYGPTRDRVIGITMVTGYGEVVRGGGRLVKNVTGYDLPRLATGACGSLGVVTEVCLKLWPEPRTSRTFPVDDAAEAHAIVYRPSAVLETNDEAFVYVEGSESAVAEASRRLGSEGQPGFRWPQRPRDSCQLAVLVPPRRIGDAVQATVSAGSTGFVAQHGIGRIDAWFGAMTQAALTDVRGSIHAIGGLVVVERWPDGEDQPDRWGARPSGLSIRGRLLDLFDPDGIFRLGQLPEMA